MTRREFLKKSLWFLAAAPVVTLISKLLKKDTLPASLSTPKEASHYRELAG